MSDEKQRRTAFTRRLRGKRQALELSQEELGKRVGVNKQAVCNWEAGRREPDLERLILLCKVLDCTSDWLLGIEQ